MRTIVFIGDSITEGVGDDEHGGWTRRLAASLPPDWQAVHAGISGNTIRDILQRLEPDALTHKPDILVLAVGINDSHQHPLEGGRNEVPLAEFKAGLRTFAAQSTKKATYIVVVGLAPVDEARSAPIEPDQHYLNAPALVFDQALQSFARETAFNYVPIWDAFVERGGAEQLTMDGLHPNPAGHALIAEMVDAALRPMM